ncbi:PhnA-like protein [Rhizobium sp. TRM96647]|uniref:PhnA-like protein n=1 Tax=unclassified Rhizobium TaxID=2613769 RepID=UPI0021E722C3|nr:MULTISPECIES: PhnA-like protein [unclassified Rhizobium]MCV3739284.1 PhnA-like protein [Rhizobium sp. TRM96647]MCV3760966.1 PhnA-like protein [Rhizobium sp. TRM96650]
MSEIANVRSSSTGIAHVSSQATAAFNRISWGAVFAGVVVALATQLLLNLLGVGIGFAVLDPAGSDNPEASTFSIAGGIWFIGAGILASLVGGYVAGRLSGRPSSTTGGYQGLTTWAATTLVILYLLTTSVGTLVGGAFQGLSSLIGGAGQVATAVATAVAPAVENTADPFGAIERQIREASGGSDPQSLRSAAVSAVRAAITTDEANAEDARNRAADAVARAQNIPLDQARTQVQRYEEGYRAAVEEAKQQAARAAEVAATTLSTAAIAGFLSLAIGAIAAWLGGMAGTKKAIVVDEDH